jgi:hypothetical protein
MLVPWTGLNASDGLLLREEALECLMVDRNVSDSYYKPRY